MFSVRPTQADSPTVPAKATATSRGWVNSTRVSGWSSNTNGMMGTSATGGVIPSRKIVQSSPESRTMASHSTFWRE